LRIFVLFVQVLALNIPFSGFLVIWSQGIKEVLQLIPFFPKVKDTSVLSVIPPPELHLMLGIINHLVQSFLASSS
jgi:hypothetical protein